MTERIVAESKIKVGEFRGGPVIYDHSEVKAAVLLGASVKCWSERGVGWIYIYRDDHLYGINKYVAYFEDEPE